MPTAADPAPHAPTAEAPRIPRSTTRDGMVLGDAVGFGFAAFESADYTFNALFTRIGLSLLGTAATRIGSARTVGAPVPVVAGDRALVRLPLGPTGIGIAAAGVGS
jgi:RsiW-degrading membrane proteinase PrsW (M82 family)